MIYKCQNCGFLHYGELKDGYICPYCRSNLQSFLLIEKEEKVYNRVNIKEDNPSLNRIDFKCINCGVCSKTCKNKVGISYDETKCDGICINCGQCILTCPSGALTPKYDYQKVLNLIQNKEYTLVAMTAPAVRVTLGDAFDMPKGSLVEGKCISALKKLGFDYVFDVSFGADLTSIEEAYELLKRIKQGKKGMFTSCCPSWVKYAEIYHPELKEDISTCKSPISMASTIIKEYFAQNENIDTSKLIIVSIVPCTSKKAEIINSDCDYALTTSELAIMIKEQGIDFKNLKDTPYDDLNGSSSGKIFGFSGGVALSVLRCLYNEMTNKDLDNSAIYIKDKEYYQEYSVKINKQIIKMAAVKTMINLEKILKIKNNYDLIEVMNCPGGCIGGGGSILMPIKDREELISMRQKNLQHLDKSSAIKYPYKNEVVISLYEEFLKEKGSAISEKLLHNSKQK